VSNIDTGVVDGLKALDPDGRLEKRTNRRWSRYVRLVARRDVADMIAITQTARTTTALSRA